MASGDSSARGRQTANLLRGHSPDPAVAARQRANLTPGRKDLHGAYSPALLGPLAEQHEAELAADYPRMDRRRRALLADRLARVELASAWTRQHGITPQTKGKGFGETHPIVDRLERWSARCEDMLGQAEAQREAGGGSPGETLESIARELAEGEPGGGAEEVGVEAQREAGGGETLASIAAELAAEGDDDDVVGTDVELPDVDGGDGDG